MLDFIIPNVQMPHRSKLHQGAVSLLFVLIVSDIISQGFQKKSDSNDVAHARNPEKMC